MNKIINKIGGTYYFDLKELYNRVRGFQLPDWVDYRTTAFGHVIVIAGWLFYWMVLSNNLVSFFILSFQTCVFVAQILIEKRENIKRYEFPWWTNRILVGVIGLFVILQFYALVMEGL